MLSLQIVIILLQEIIKWCDFVVRKLALTKQAYFIHCFNGKTGQTWLLNLDEAEFNSWINTLLHLLQNFGHVISAL